MSKKLKSKIVVVNDKMQKGYKYELVEKIGKNFHKDFHPDLTPKQMLSLGVFGGKYMTDCTKEFPKDWFVKVKLSPDFHDKELNLFKVNASQPLSVWRKNGWIYKDDPRGWFQWYCRYFMGRRIEKEDERQIKRWRAMTRHIAQVTKNCRMGDISCRPVQRQALLHWAYDSRKI
jgi:PAS domain-containing protein